MEQRGRIFRRREEASPLADPAVSHRSGKVSRELSLLAVLFGAVRLTSRRRLL